MEKFYQAKGQFPLPFILRTLEKDQLKQRLMFIPFMYKIERLFLGLVLSLIFCSSLSAATITWTAASAASPNDFLNPFNWDLLRAPLPDDDVIIPGGLSDYPEDVADGITFRSLLIQTGGVFRFSSDISIIDATGCNCNAITIETGASLEVGQSLIIRNASGDGIVNQGTIFLSGRKTGFGPLTIENVGGVGINNQAGGNITLDEDEGPTTIRNTGGTSVINNGTFTISRENWLFVDNGISDPGNGFLNQGNLIITGGGNSDIDTNEGIVHYEAVGSFSVNTVNGGLLFTDPDEIVTVFPRASGRGTRKWFENDAWSKFRAPLPGDKVIIQAGSPDFAFDNRFGTSGVSHAPFISLQSLSIEQGRTLDIRCTTLEVEDINVSGILLIGDNVTPFSGQLIVKNTFTNSGSVDNDGLITNLTGGTLGGTITGGGSERTSRADVIWTGAVNTNWDNGDNWSTGVEPGAGDEVYIPNCTTCPTISSTGNTINSLLMEGDLTIAINGALEVDGSGMDCWANGIVLVGAVLNNEGELLIENSQQNGIHGYTCTIINNGNLTIQETIADAITANHASSLTNSSDGIITLTNIGADGIRLGYGGQFNNQNQITGNNLGNNANGPGDGEPFDDGYGKGLFILVNGRANNSGSIQFNTTLNDAVFIFAFSEFIHSGSLTTIDSQQDGGIETSTGSFTHITETGTVSVLRCGNEGMESDVLSEVLNEGEITLSFAGMGPTESPTESIDIDEGSIMTNNGTITISNAGDEFMEVDENSKFFNNGTWSGKTTFNDDGSEGIDVDEYSTLINRGKLTIDETAAEGIRVRAGTIVENYGTMQLQNVGALDNRDQDPDEKEDGILVLSHSTFLNCGELSIIGNTEMGNGIIVDENSTFNNTLSINITDAAEYGIFVTDDLANQPNGGNLFTNTFDITIAGSGISDIRNDNQFDNAECGLIRVEDGFNNGSSGVFNNEGQLVIAGDFTNTGTLNNNGVIADPDGSVAAAGIEGNIIASEANLPIRKNDCFEKLRDPEDIPTMNQWGKLIFILFVLSLFVFGVLRLQGRNTVT